MPHQEKNAELFHMEPPPPPDTDIEEAVRSAFTDLDEQNLLGPVERAKRAALVKAAAALDRAMAEEKMSVATSNILKQVMEGLDGLPKPAVGNDYEIDAFDAALAALTEQSLGAR